MATDISQIAVAASADDAWEEADGTVTINGTDQILDLGVVDWMGFRFTSVPIPAGAVINTCSITPYIGSPKNDPALNIHCEEGNAAAFTTGSGNISGRTLTTTVADW